MPYYKKTGSTYIQPTEKACKVCKEVKPINKFNAACKSKYGYPIYQPICKVCQNDQRRLRLYGVTAKGYKDMLIKQEYKCAICGINHLEWQASTANGKQFCVDHNHKTGKVRGLLCGNCNRGIGCLQDNSKIVRLAYKHLTKN